MSQTIAPAPSISRTLIQPFIVAVRDVFHKMAKVEITCEKPHLKEGNHTSYEVCGIIGFSGHVSGSVVVSFSDQAALKLVEAFVGEKIDRNTPDFADAIGELANMIAGGAKQHLGGSASISVPNVVIGKGYQIANMSQVPCLVIPCKSPHGDFAIEVCIKQR